MSTYAYYSNFSMGERYFLMFYRAASKAAAVQLAEATAAKHGLTRTVTHRHHRGLSGMFAGRLLENGRPVSLPLLAKRKEPLIDIRKFPPRFMTDSFEREIFKPASWTHATVSEVRALLSDAEHYAHPYGPDNCPAGIIMSAHATVRHCKKALAPFEGKK